MADFPFDAILFDLDGTLADTSPDLAAAVNHALAGFGRQPVPPASMRRMVGHGARAMLRQALEHTGGCDEGLLDAGLPVLLAHYEAHICNGSFAFPGVEAALDDLARRGVKAAVCTNKLERLARLFVTAIGWDGRFAAIVGGDSAGVAKPDPAPVRLALAQAGGGRAAFVGDSISDTGASRAAGMPCVVLSFGFHDRPPDQLGGDALIDHFDALIPALERLG